MKMLWGLSSSCYSIEQSTSRNTHRRALTTNHLMHRRVKCSRYSFYSVSHLVSLQEQAQTCNCVSTVPLSAHHRIVTIVSVPRSSAASKYTETNIWIKKGLSFIHFHPHPAVFLFSVRFLSCFFACLISFVFPLSVLLRMTHQAFCFFYGVQSRQFQRRGSTSSSGTSLSTDLESGRLLGDDTD